MMLAWGLGISCSAPHDNPLDPESGFYIPPPDTQNVPTVPTFNTSLRTVHVARYGTSLQSYYVLAEAWPDSNVSLDSAKIQYLEGARRGLGLSSGRWSAALTTSALGVSSLEAVIGNPFTFYMYVTGDTVEYTKQPCFVFRVLNEIPLTDSPDSNAITSPWPTLLWPQFSSLYPARLQVTVQRYFDFQFDELIWTSDTLIATTTQISVPDSLEDGDLLVGFVCL